MILLNKKKLVHDLHANSTKVTEMCESLCLIAFKA